MSAPTATSPVAKRVKRAAKGGKKAKPAPLPSAAEPAEDAGEQERESNEEEDEDDEDDDDDGDAFIDPGKKVAKEDGLIRVLLKKMAEEKFDGDMKAALKSLRLSSTTMKTYNYEWRKWTQFIFSKAGLPWEQDKIAEQVAALKAFIQEKVRGGSGGTQCHHHLCIRFSRRATMISWRGRMTTFSTWASPGRAEESHGLTMRLLRAQIFFCPSISSTPFTTAR